MFVTHHKPARRLGKPRSVIARPEAFRPSRVGTTGGAAGGRAQAAGPGRQGEDTRLDDRGPARLLARGRVGQRAPRALARGVPVLRAVPRRLERVGADGGPARAGRAAPGARAAAWQPVAHVRAVPAGRRDRRCVPQPGERAGSAGPLRAVPRRVDGRAVPRPAAAERSPGRAVHLHAPPDARPVRRRAPVGRAAPRAPVRTAVHVDPTRRLRPSTAAELPASSVPTEARRDILHAVGATPARAGGRHRGAAVRRHEACRGAHRPHQPRRGTRGRRPALACATARRTLRRSAQHRARSHRRHLGADEPRRSASRRHERPDGGDQGSDLLALAQEHRRPRVHLGGAAAGERVQRPAGRAHPRRARWQCVDTVGRARISTSSVEPEPPSHRTR